MPEQVPAPLLIHVGFPKTGSTWLQRRLFSDPESGFSAPWSLPTHELIDEFATVYSYCFDPSEARRKFEARAERVPAGHVPVLSHEVLTGNSVDGTAWGREVAQRLALSFPEAFVLICIREQRSALLSSYGEYIRGGGQKSVEDYLGVRTMRAGFRPPCRLELFEYHHIIAHYQSLFGKERLLVLPFEELRRDPVAYANSIIDFVRSRGVFDKSPVPVHRSARGVSLAIRRRVNRFAASADFSTGRSPLSFRLATLIVKATDRLVPARMHRVSEMKLKSRIEQAVVGRFGLSNRNTAKLTGLDLGKYGYDMDDAGR